MANQNALGHHLLFHQQSPLVFTDSISHWDAENWTPEGLAQIFKERELRFRIGKKESIGINWENQCKFRDMTVEDFLEWEAGNLDGNFDQVMAEFDHSKYWAYFDYKHMPDVFKSNPESLKSVDWSKFGFPGRGGEQSTFWFGSAGAHTQCHYDTYGCNLVAQIYGRKQWVLFPPSQTEFMYPTRIPYEESSVFSLVNIASPNIGTHPKFKETTPYIITLEPGDVMFIPKHWWHDVKSLSTSISINSWIDMPSDDTERVREAITRCVVMGMMDSSLNIPEEKWLNPTETETADPENIEYLKKALVQESSKSSLESAKESNPSEQSSKFKKLKTVNIEGSREICDYCKDFMKHDCDKSVNLLTPIGFEQYFTNVGIPDERESAENSDSNFKSPISHMEVSELYLTLVECLSDPRVIDIVEGLLKEKVQNSEPSDQHVPPITAVRK